MDPDGDGLGNLLETALGLNPNLPSLPPIGIRQADRTWLWNLTLPAAYTSPGHPSYALEYSADLSTWLSGTTTTVSNTLTTATTRLLTLRHTIPGNPARVYDRLRATLP